MTNEEVQEIIDRAEDEYDRLKDRAHEQYDEIERLNNIIKKYDIFLKHELSFEGHSEEWIENKLRELKGSDKE